MPNEKNTHARRASEMDRKLMGEIYRRLVIALHRARVAKDEATVRHLTEQLIELELALGGDGRGIAALIR